MGLFGSRRKKALPAAPKEASEAPPPPPTDDPQVDLPRMVAAIQAAAPAAAEAPIDLVLLRAQWGDLCRDAEEPRPGAAAFAGLESEPDLRRAGLLMRALLSQPDAVALFEEGAVDRNAQGHVHCSLVLPATQLSLLTPTLLAESPLRAEEMARAFAASLGVGIAGETEATSEAALRRLDYRRLLAGADRAKAKAADKMDYLKALYKAQEDLRPRGKW